MTTKVAAIYAILEDALESLVQDDQADPGRIAAILAISSRCCAAVA